MSKAYVNRIEVLMRVPLKPRYCLGCHVLVVIPLQCHTCVDHMEDTLNVKHLEPRKIPKGHFPPCAAHRLSWRGHNIYSVMPF